MRLGNHRLRLHQFTRLRHGHVYVDRSGYRKLARVSDSGNARSWAGYHDAGYRVQHGHGLRLQYLGIADRSGIEYVRRVHRKPNGSFWAYWPNRPVWNPRRAFGSVRADGRNWSKRRYGAERSQRSIRADRCDWVYRFYGSYWSKRAIWAERRDRGVWWKWAVRSGWVWSLRPDHRCNRGRV